METLAPPPPSYNELVKDNSKSLDHICQKYEISNFYLEKMAGLSDYEIVFLIDDSGSMRTPLTDGEHSNRWQELKYVSKIAIELGTIFDDSGIDIYFLNREGRNNVSNLDQMEHLFHNEPYGRTPLTHSLTVLFDQYINSEKPILFVIATDGVPTNHAGYPDINPFMDLIKSKNDKFHISFLACSDQNDDIEYLNILDKNVKYVDTLDDYLSEKKEVQSVQGNNYKYSLGDHVARLLLGPICPELDSLDESKISKSKKKCTIL
jgi:hypothetical protein